MIKTQEINSFNIPKAEQAKPMNKLFVLKTIAIFVLLFIIVVAISYIWKDYQLKQDEKKMAAMNSQILDGASTNPTEINIDYSKSIATGSPMIFGGSHTPPLDQTDAWSQIKDVGVTAIRKDLYVEFTTPKNMSIEDYKQNKGNVQDIESWDLSGINNVKNNLRLIRKNGMKTMGIMAYSPAWLNTNNSPFGVPLDWGIYKDVVKKLYTEYRDDLDFVEIWNEPDNKNFLKTDGSNTTKAEVYAKIYQNASEAIREVDKEKNDGKIMPIGAAVESNPTVSNILGSLLADPNTTIKPNFISFHDYDEDYTTFLNVYKEDRDKYLNPDTPIFLTEWNRESTFSDVSQEKTGNKAIMFTGNRFINYLKDGIGGANYFSMLSINTKNGIADQNSMGFYKVVNGKAELLPQARTWTLMSNKMLLGKGPSNIYSVNYDKSDINSIGFKNSAMQSGAVLANNSTDSQMLNLKFNNTGIKKYANVAIYYASADNDAKTPVYQGQVKVKNGDINLLVYVPKNALAGITLTEEKEWFDFLNLPY